jgi:hypothetical protein
MQCFVSPVFGTSVFGTYVGESAAKEAISSHQGYFPCAMDIHQSLAWLLNAQPLHPDFHAVFELASEFRAPELRHTI